MLVKGITLSLLGLILITLGFLLLFWVKRNKAKKLEEEKARKMMEEIEDRELKVLEMEILQNESHILDISNNVLDDSSRKLYDVE